MALGLDEVIVHKTGWQARGQRDRRQAQCDGLDVEVAYSKTTV
jgi:hypothetical protein